MKSCCCTLTGIRCPFCSFRLSSSSHLRKFRGGKKDDEVCQHACLGLSLVSPQFFSYSTVELFLHNLGSLPCWDMRLCMLPVSTILFLPPVCPCCICWMVECRVHGSAVIMFQMTRRRRKRREKRMGRRGSGDCNARMMRRSM